MSELEKVHNMLSMTKKVKDKCVNVDTFMDDCPLPVGETVPYDVQINLEFVRKGATVDVPMLNNRVQRKIDSLRPTEKEEKKRRPEQNTNQTK